MERSPSPALLVLAIAGLALAAFLASWRTPLPSAAAASATLGGLLALLRLRHEARGRRAADREAVDAQARVSNIVEAAMDAIITTDAQQRAVLQPCSRGDVRLAPRRGARRTAVDVHSEALSPCACRPRDALR